MKNQKRILSRVLAKELSPEELEQVAGSSDSQNSKRPPVSTLAATLPDYSEDQ
jgi:hypothetical protein